MTGSVSALGYTVPITIVLVFVALVIGLGLAVLFWLTIGWSVYRSVGQTRRERVEEELEGELLDGMFDPETDWEPWVSSLSDVERDVVESLLDEYLREIEGADVESLRDLGDELGITERSKRRLERRGEYTHLYALTWLTLLARPDAIRESDFEPSTPRERAAVARLRYETDDLPSPAAGVSVLLSEAESQFTVFGQDTLYRIATDDPDALFEVAADAHESWSYPLLVQVLSVCRHLGTNTREADFSWVIESLDHEDEAVREAAVLALSDVGWREDVRETVSPDRLAADPSPRVRGTVYRTLARWGDDRAVDALVDALSEESDPRARLTGTDALVRQRDQLPTDSPETLRDAWAWSSEHAAFDRVARGTATEVGD